MSDALKPSRWAREARCGTAQAFKRSDAVLPVRVDLPGAKVTLLPGHFRNDDYVRTHVQGVVAMEAERGERHIVRNLAIIGDKLRSLGIDEASVVAELQIIEGRVRAELWRQIMTPDGQS